MSDLDTSGLEQLFLRFARAVLERLETQARKTDLYQTS